MTRRPIRSPYSAIEKAGKYQCRYLEGELLRYRDGTNRFGNLDLYGSRKNRGRSEDGKVFKRADDGIGWEEMDETTPKTRNQSTSIRTIQGGAPGLGKKS